MNMFFHYNVFASQQQQQNVGEFYLICGILLVDCSYIDLNAFQTRDIVVKN